METRSKPRFEFTLTVKCEICKQAEDNICLTKGNKFELKAFDISETGIGAASSYFLPKDTNVELEISGEPFGLSENMKIKGEVRHSKFVRVPDKYKYRCGILFLDISDEYKKAIAAFIAKYDRRGSSRLDLK